MSGVGETAHVVGVARDDAISRLSDEDNTGVNRVRQLCSPEERAAGAAEGFVNRDDVDRRQKSSQVGLPPSWIAPHLGNHERMCAELEPIALCCLQAGKHSPVISVYFDQGARIEHQGGHFAGARLSPNSASAAASSSAVIAPCRFSQSTM